MFKQIIKISINGIKKITCSPRYTVVLIITLLFIFQNLSPINDIVKMTNIKTNPLLFPFVASSPVFQFTLMIGVVFLFSDAPFMDSNQQYIIIRSGRYRWVMGQILYIIMITIIFFAIIMLFSVLILLPNGTFATQGWGKIVNTLLQTDAGSQIQLPFSISANIVNNLTPLRAFFYSFLFQCLSGAIIGTFMFFISLLFKKSIGVISGALVILFDFLIINNFGYNIFKYSPVSLSRIALLDYLKISSLLPTFNYALVYMICLMIVLSIACLFMIKNFSVEKI